MGNICWRSFRESMNTWYRENYPTDELGVEISNRPFIDLLEALVTCEDVYDTIGVGDSLVRERLFARLSEIVAVDYDTIYRVWLDTVA